MLLKSTTARLYAAGIGFAVFLAVLRMFGMSLVDFAQLARVKAVAAAADARALVSRDVADKYGDRLREEAAAIPAVAPSAEGKDAVEISREVQVERRRILEERADNLQKIGSGLITGDLATIRKQAEENARRAGGGQ